MFDRRLRGERCAQFLQAQECIPTICLVRRLREKHEAVPGAGEVLDKVRPRTVEHAQSGSGVQSQRSRAHAWQSVHIHDGAVVVRKMHQPPAAEEAKALRHRHGHIVKISMQGCRVPRETQQVSIDICKFRLSSAQRGARN